MFADKWGIVRHTPGCFPVWFFEARWSEAKAKELAEKYNDLERRATILRHPPGTRYFPIRNGTPFSITQQFARIMERERHVC